MSNVSNVIIQSPQDYMHVDFEGEARRELQLFLQYLSRRQLIKKKDITTRLTSLRSKNKFLRQVLPRNMPDDFFDPKGPSFKLKAVEVMYLLFVIWILVADDIEGHMFETHEFQSMAGRLHTCYHYLRRSFTNTDIVNIGQMQKEHHR